jgi:hypothetical protein
MCHDCFEQEAASKAERALQVRCALCNEESQALVREWPGAMVDLAEEDDSHASGVAPSVLSSLPSGRPNASASASASALFGCHVLVADDVDIVRDVHKAVLVGLGCTVAEVMTAHRTYSPLSTRVA